MSPRYSRYNRAVNFISIEETEQAQAREIEARRRMFGGGSEAHVDDEFPPIETAWDAERFQRELRG